MTGVLPSAAMDSQKLASAVAAILLGLAGVPVAGQLTSVFADGFESGNTLAWSASVGEPALPPAEVFRLSDLDLRDPHLFVSPGFGCFDFTDQDVPLFPGSAFNNQLQATITGDSEPDGLLDSSFLLEFRPFDEVAMALRLDIGPGLCSAPVAGTSCAPDPSAVAQTTVAAAWLPAAAWRRSPVPLTDRIRRRSRASPDPASCRRRGGWSSI